MISHIVCGRNFNIFLVQNFYRQKPQNHKSPKPLIKKLFKHPLVHALLNLPVTIQCIPIFES